MNRNERRELSSFARKMLKTKVSDFEYPGGENRDSVRLRLANGKSVIATRRPSDDRAQRELDVLKALGEHGASVPKIYGFDGTYLLQQDLGTTRLSQALHAGGGKDEIKQLLDAALSSMAAYQEASRSTNLVEQLPKIGHELNWRQALSKVPFELAEFTGIEPPEYDADAVAELLSVKTPSFVKWDSRPGNALISKSGKGYWFDWEHCGVRNAVDDLVWLMADEFVTFDKRMETDLFNTYLGAFSLGMSPEETEHYVRTLGCFHTCVRLQLVLSNKGDGKWWSMTKCLDGDKVGVTKRCSRRLVWRATDWADHDPLTRPLVAWFKATEDYIEAL